jgi:hypothetical protein
MRLLILFAGAALSLAACRNNDQADNTMNVDENLTAENIVANDITAIDAVTGEDANMAANVNYLEPETNNAASNATSGNRSSSAAPSRPRAATPPATNTAAEPVTNNATAE